MTDQEYFAARGVSATFLKTCALQSLAHARAQADTPRKQTPAMALGSAFHARVFEPNVYAERWLNDRLFAGDNATAEERRRAMEGMWKSVNEHETARELLLAPGGVNEVPIFWQDHGLDAKAKLDHIFNHAVVDLKTAADASERGFSRAVFSNYRYDIQAAWYMRAARAAGHTIDRFVFVVVESDAPYPCAVYELDQAAIDNADEEIGILLPRIKDAYKTGHWPAYPTGTSVLYMPAWMGIES